MCQNQNATLLVISAIHLFISPRLLIHLLLAASALVGEHHDTADDFVIKP